MMKPQTIKDKLLSFVDQNYNVLQSAEVLSLLIKLKDIDLTREDLEETRLGKLVNSIRRSSKDSQIMTISKSLIKYWQVKFLPETKPVPANTNLQVDNSTWNSYKIPKKLKNSTSINGVDDKTNIKEPCKRKRIQSTAELISSINYGGQKLMSPADLDYIDQISLETYKRDDCPIQIVPSILQSKPRKARTVSSPKTNKNSPLIVKNEPILLRIKLSDIQKDIAMKPNVVTPQNKKKRPRHEDQILPKRPKLSPRSDFRRSIRSQLPAIDRDNLPLLKWMGPNMQKNTDGSYDSTGKLRGWTECYRVPSLENDVCVIFPYCDLPSMHQIRF